MRCTSSRLQKTDRLLDNWGHLGEPSKMVLSRDSCEVPGLGPQSQVSKGAEREGGLAAAH